MVSRPEMLPAKSCGFTTQKIVLSVSSGSASLDRLDRHQHLGEVGRDGDGLHRAHDDVAVLELRLAGRETGGRVEGDGDGGAALGEGVPGQPAGDQRRQDGHDPDQRNTTAMTDRRRRAGSRDPRQREAGRQIQAALARSSFLVRPSSRGVQRSRLSMSRARTSRLPTWLAALTTPSRSMRSTMRAARL